MYQLEFLIEPFVEGHPGPHVTAAVEAAEGAGATVEFGPFGSTCRADGAAMPAIVGAILAAALSHGATHVSIQVVELGEAS